MDIEGLGESLIDQLVTAGLVHDAADVYALTAPALEALDRMGKKSAANLVARIDRSRRNEVWRLIYGLGIRHVGERAAQVLGGQFGGVEAIAAQSTEALQTVPNRAVLAASVAEWFSDEANRRLLTRLAAAGVTMSGPVSGQAVVTGRLSGKTVVLTGTLTAMSREEATAKSKRSAGA